MGTANIVFGYNGAGVARDHASFSPIESEALATDTTSAATTASAPAAAAVDGRELVARVWLSEDGWVWPGAAPTATKTTTGIRVEAETEFFLALAPGDKIAVLDDA